MTHSIVFMDTETLGLDWDSPVWEFAAVRRDYVDQVSYDEMHVHFQIRHDPAHWLDDLPDEFANDYRARYSQRTALPKGIAVQTIRDIMHDRPTVVGAVPSFDTTRLAHQLLRPFGVEEPWHYHVMDIENIIVGYLVAKGISIAPPYKSDDLSMAVGVLPTLYDRHTAMGDVLWAMAQWDKVFGTPDDARRSLTYHTHEARGEWNA